jgi:hypothetical protein
MTGHAMSHGGHVRRLNDARSNAMIRRSMFALIGAVALGSLMSPATAEAQQAYGRSWGGSMNTQDWNRFYHYPYVYYPQNYYGNEYTKSAQDMYYRYPQEMRIPVYNKSWQNYYPEPRLYHSGAHFLLDVF